MRSVVRWGGRLLTRVVLPAGHVAAVLWGDVKATTLGGDADDDDLLFPAGGWDDGMGEGVEHDGDGDGDGRGRGGGGAAPPPEGWDRVLPARGGGRGVDWGAWENVSVARPGVGRGGWGRPDGEAGVRVEEVVEGVEGVVGGVGDAVGGVWGEVTRRVSEVMDEMEKRG